MFHVKSTHFENTAFGKDCCILSASSNITTSSEPKAHYHDSGTTVASLRPDIRIGLRGTAAIAAVAGVVRFGFAIDNQWK